MAKHVKIICHLSSILYVLPMKKWFNFGGNDLQMRKTIKNLDIADKKYHKSYQQNYIIETKVMLF